MRDLWSVTRGDDSGVSNVFTVSIEVITWLTDLGSSNPVMFISAVITNSLRGNHVELVAVCWWHHT